MACKGTFLLIEICDTWAKEALEHMRLAAEGKIEFNPEEANRRVAIISALGDIALAQTLP